jgi:arsenate reductase (glutaredoxin)
MLKIYHNPRCRKSCKGLKYLESKGAEFKVFRYLEQGISISEIKEILLKLNKKPQDIIRTQEDYYKKELKGKKFNDEEWIKIIVENPKLLIRPIVVGKYKAVIAQPPSLADVLFK